MTTKRTPHDNRTREHQQHAGRASIAKLTPEERLARCRNGGLAYVAKYGVERLKELGRKGGERFNERYIADRNYSTIHHANLNDDEADQYADYEKPL